MIKYLRKNMELVPLLFFTSLGMFGAFGYLARLALKGPDVSWDRKNNQHPWLNIQPGQRVKFFGHRDLSTVVDHKHVRPEEVKHL